MACAMVYTVVVAGVWGVIVDRSFWFVDNYVDDSDLTLVRTECISLLEEI